MNRLSSRIPRSISGMLCVVCVFLSLVSLPTYAERVPRSKRVPPAKKYASLVGIFGAVYGSFGSGNITVQGKTPSFGRSEFKGDGGTAYGGFVDIPVYRLVWLGVSLDHVEVPYYGESNNSIDFSLHCKLQFVSHDGRLAIRPSGAIGHGVVSNVSGYNGQINVTTGRYYLEGLAFFTRRIGVEMQIGQYYGLSGGSHDFDITGGPFTFFRAGLVFGRLK